MSNTITPTVFYRTLNVEGLEIFYRSRSPGCSHRSALARLSVVFSYVRRRSTIHKSLELSVPPLRLILFLIAAFCRLAKSLSSSEEMG